MFLFRPLLSGAVLMLHASICAGNSNGLPLHAKDVGRTGPWIHATADGLTIRSESDDGEDLHIRVIGTKRPGTSLVPWCPIGECEATEQTIWQDPVMEVHYSEVPVGIRQDFLVNARLGGAGPLQVILGYSDGFTAALEGTSAARFDRGPGSVIHSYNGLKAWDACGTPLISWMAIDAEHQQLTLNVNDQGAQFPITIDPVASTPSTLLVGNIAGGRFGKSVNTAGDLNGDGYSDVVVGARDAAQGQAGEGLAYLYYGTSAGIGTTPDLILEIDQAGASFGNSVSTAGDINGDGFGDLLVGAPNWESDAAIPQEGAIFIYYGSATGINSVPDETRRANSANKYMGWSAACAGDINNDGYSDIITGGWLAAFGQSNEGVAWVFLGGPAGLAAAPVHRLERNQGAAQFGYSVAGAGDVNGDGYSDVVIGAHGFDLNTVNDGATFIYHGGPNGLGAVFNPPPTLVFSGPPGSTRSGWAVSTAGDVNGDGFSDIITGHYNNDVGGPFQEGTAFVHHGSASGIDPVPATILQSEQANGWLGRSVATAGDMNGDGYADVLVGAVTYSNGQANEGVAFLYLGSATGIYPVAHRIFELNIGGANVGESVGVAGDVNGDGYSDVMVGAENYSGALIGGAAIYLGGTESMDSAPAVQLTYAQAGAHAGWSVAHAGDINGDGFSDAIIGARDASSGQAGEGLAYIHMGSTTGISAVPTLTLQNNVAGARFGASVSTAGDVDGDGYADVVVGAPDAGGTGRVYVYMGSPSGLDPTPALTLNGTAGSEFGASVMTAGDVNSDGYADLIIGAPGIDGCQVHLGSISGLIATPQLNFTAPQPGSRFGHAVSTAGDVNGDGYSDVIIGAPLFSNGQVDEGAAFVYHGSDTSLADVADRQLELNVAGSNMGMSVSGVGDVNGDGYDEVALGGDLHTAGQLNEGRVTIYRGAPTGITTVLNNFYSNVVGARLGYSVAEAGDVNGDGYADVVAGAPFLTQTLNEQGRIFLWLGSPTGLGDQRIITGGTTDASLGWSVAGGGDLDGDGYSDLLASAPFDSPALLEEGRVFWHKGNEGLSLGRLTRQYLADLVTPLSTNSLDFAVSNFFGVGHRSRSHIQRTGARIVWEVVFEGQPFSGSPITNSTLSTGTGSVFTDLVTPGIELKELVFKQPGHIRYKWRLRLEYPLNKLIDGQRYSRWYYGFASGTGDIGILPVELLDLQGTAIEEGNLITWSTGSEQNSDHFEVQRSTDLEHFAPIGRVGAQGSSQFLVPYEFLDASPPQGLAYYRLRMVDTDLAAEFSPVIAVDSHGEMVRIFPNPVEDRVYWPTSSATSVQVYDMLGRKVLHASSLNGSTPHLDVHELPAGTYSLRLVDGSGSPIARGRFLKL